MSKRDKPGGIGDWMRALAGFADAVGGAAERGARIGDKVDEAKAKMALQKCVSPGCPNPVGRKRNGEPWAFCQECFRKSVRGAVQGALGPVFGSIFGEEEQQKSAPGQPEVVVVEVKQNRPDRGDK